MGNYLISGLPGTGKSSIDAQLEALGYETFSTDETIGYYGNFKTEEPVSFPKQSTKEWFTENGWIWNGDQLRQKLTSHGDAPLFVCGGSRNEQKFYELFDKIFVLHVSNGTLRSRLEARHDQKQKTNTELFISRMTDFNQDAYTHAQSIGAVIVETELPIEECVNKILSTIHE